MQKAVKKAILLSIFLGLTASFFQTPPLYAISLTELETKLDKKIFGFAHSADYLFYSTGKNGFFAAPNTKHIEADFSPRFLRRDAQKQAYVFSSQKQGELSEDKETDQTLNPTDLTIYRLHFYDTLLLVGHERGVDIVDISHLTQSLQTAKKTLRLLEKEKIRFPILTTASLDTEKIKDPRFEILGWLNTLFEKNPKGMVKAFTPFRVENQFYLVKAMGSEGLTIDAWDVAHLPKTIRLGTLVRIYRSGRLGPPQRIHLMRRSRLSQSYYDLYDKMAGQPDLMADLMDPAADAQSELLKNLNRVQSASLALRQLLICTPQGIDTLDLDHLLNFLAALHSGSPDGPPDGSPNGSPNGLPTLHIEAFQPLPFATGIALFESTDQTTVWQNRVWLTSQWQPGSPKALLTVFADDNEPLKQWTIRSAIHNLSLEPTEPHQTTVRLFGSAGPAGIHVFDINLRESAIHPNFIKRFATISPHHLKKGQAGDIRGAWLSHNTLTYLSYDHNSVSLEEGRTSELIDAAQRQHRDRLDQARNWQFEAAQAGRGLWNGLVAAIPFDADKLVDVIGFDLNGNLRQQLEAYNVADSITDEELQSLQTLYHHYQLGGELLGYVGMAWVALKKIAAIRQLRMTTTSRHVAYINGLRAELGFFNKGQPGSSLLLNADWLAQLPRYELLVTTQRFKTQLAELNNAILHGKLFSSPELRQIVAAMEKRSVLRPLERVLVKTFGYDPLLGNLERWSVKQMAKLFEIAPQEELVSIFGGGFVAIERNWQKLKQLETLEVLSEFQKIEQMALSVKTKQALLEALTMLDRLDHLSPAVTKTLMSLKNRLKIKHADPELALLKLAKDTRHLSEKLARSEYAYRLERVIALNKKAPLTDLEKLEQFRHLIKTGWTGKSGLPFFEPPKKVSILSKLDEIYDFEQMRRSGYLARIFKRGKYWEALAYTAYSDLANIGTEAVARGFEGRPLWTKGLAHNIIWNSYAMFPIFAISGLRVGTKGKIFILVVNAASTGYMGHKLTKYWYTLTKPGLLPAPQIPFQEMPGYIWRDMFEEKRPLYNTTFDPFAKQGVIDPEFNAGWVLFDNIWVLLLSTPRGITASALSTHLQSLPWLDSRPIARMALTGLPVAANETLGAALYPPSYGHFFEERHLQLYPIDIQLETVDPWEAKGEMKDYTALPRVRLKISVRSSTPPKAVTFRLLKKSLSNPENTLETREIRVGDFTWEEDDHLEQHYHLAWQEEVPFEEEPMVYEIRDLTLSNEGRRVGDNFRFWEGRKYEDGVTLKPPHTLLTLVQKRDPFDHGLFKVLLKLAYEASDLYEKNKPQAAAGIIHLIRYVLIPFKREILVEQKTAYSRGSDIRALIALNESIRITGSVNTSDYPVDPAAIRLLRDQLGYLVYQAIPQGHLEVKPQIAQLDFQRAWLIRNTRTVLTAAIQDILVETQTVWLVLDKGNKSDWNTTKFFKGYCAGLSKLLRWYTRQYADPENPDDHRIKNSFGVLDDLKKIGDEMSDWSDDTLRDFAEALGMLKQQLVEEAR